MIFCKKCRKRVGSKEELTSHYIGIHGITPVNCDLCQHPFRSEQEMLDHKNAKHNPCPTCDKKFVKAAYLKQHMKDVHEKEERKSKDVGHPCPVCPYKASDDGDLMKHKAIHVEQKCSECEETFPSASQYHKHRKQSGHDRQVKKRKTGSISSENINNEIN